LGAGRERFFHSRSEAMRAPSVMALNFAQTTLSWIS
jgi:hypothetical protein